MTKTFSHSIVSLSLVTVLLVNVLGTETAFAQAAPFKDLPSTDPAAPAVEYLRAQGVLQGYSDGTFRPNQVVTRAEALKMIVAPKNIDLSGFTSSPFSDVPAGSWFLPYVEAGRTKYNIVQNAPAFRPGDSVKRAEFLKFFLLGNGIDVNGSWKDITGALAMDVHATDWFYDFFRFALGSSMIQVDTAGTLNPGSALTRGQVATIMYRYAMYTQGRRTQALLSESESEILNVLSMIEQKELDRADEASNRSILAARGALVSKPDAPIVKGAVKISEGFGFITRAYRAGSEQRFDDAVSLAGQGWQSGAKAQEFSPDLKDLVSQMQTIAKSVADSARAAKAGAVSSK